MIRLGSCLFVVVFCLTNTAWALRSFTADEIRVLARYTEDIGMPRSSRVRRDGAELANESPVRLGSAGKKILNGVTRIASNLPQFSKDGRHYWPSAFSLTSQIGLQGVNGLVDDVVNYERTRALAVARDASCAQRVNCWLSQNAAAVKHMFGTLREDQKRMQGIDCDAVFSGCQFYE